MASTNHHRNDYQLADDTELRAEGRIDIGDANTQAHCAISTDDFEQNREQVEFALLNLRAFADSDDEKAERDVPQVER
jgi:hypothetical protein